MPPRRYYTTSPAFPPIMCDSYDSYDSCSWLIIRRLVTVDCAIPDVNLRFSYNFRASQKLNLNGSSPHRRKRRGSQGEDAAAAAASHGFASGLHKHAPPLPALLQRRIAGKELTGVGKVSSRFAMFVRKFLGKR